MGSLTHFNLAGVRALHGLRGFVETGTATGDGAEQALMAGFDPVHTIEIVPEIAAAARFRFKSHPSVHVWDGSSAFCLPMILKELPAEPCLFWLDAHFPGGQHGAGYSVEPDMDLRLPLENEIRLIREARPDARDVLLIDDARIYVQSPYFSSADKYTKPMADGTWPGLKGVRRSLDFLRDLYGNTHGMVVDYADQGYVMVFPRIIAHLKAA